MAREHFLLTKEQAQVVLDALVFTQTIDISLEASDDYDKKMRDVIIQLSSFINATSDNLTLNNGILEDEGWVERLTSVVKIKKDEE